MTHFLSPSEMASITGGRWLDAPPADITGIGTDTRDQLNGRMFVALRGERFDAHEFLGEAATQGAVGCMVDRPNVVAPIPRLLVNDSLIALQALATVWRQRLPKALCIAITGSAGKTTTRRLVEAACAAFGPTHASPKNFNNHLGVPLTLLSAPPETQFLVLEIGMNHPGEIEPLARMAAPRVAMVMNAGTAHLEGLGSREAIAREKATLARGLQPAGLLVVQGDHDHLLAAALREPLPAGGKVYGFGVRGLNAFRMVHREQRADGAQTITAFTPSGVIHMDLQLSGAHNAMNALGALAALMGLGLSADRVVAAMATVAPADMRMARSDMGGISIFNDAYNANPDAMLAAIATFAELTGTMQRRVVALGDMLELGEQSDELHAMVGRHLGRAFAAGPPDVFLACGKNGTHFVRGLVEVAPHAAFEISADLQQDSARLAARLRPGDAVLVKGSRGSGMERLVTAISLLHEQKKGSLIGR